MTRHLALSAPMAVSLTLLAMGARAAPAPVDVAIRKAEAAMGGIERLHGLKSLVLRGYQFEGAYRSEYSTSRANDSLMARMAPNLRIVGCRPELPGCKDAWSGYVEAYDGQRGWELNWPRQRMVRTVNKAEQALRCGAEFLPLFVDYRQRGFKATWLGPQALLGRNTVAVRVDEQGCSSATYFFDPATYDLEMTELTIPVHARGEPHPTLSVYGAFTTVAGVRWPSRAEEVDLDTGKVLGGGEWTSIQANVVSSRTVFEAPVVHPSGITAVVLRMLASAARHASVSDTMALYEAYRATPQGKSVDVYNDMNWLGYELLKVDDYRTALAVFEQMIAEVPASADAYDSIGDAYAQQGDAKAAIAAYDRALALDPKIPQTQSKRDKLAGQANAFHDRAIGQHLQIGIATMDLLRQEGPRLHSRKLRSFDEPPFR